MRGTAEISSYGYAYSIYDDPDYDNGDNYTIPEDYELVWFLCDKALNIECYDGAVWKDVETGAGEPIFSAIDKPLIISNPLYSFGGLNVGSIRVSTPATNNHHLQACIRRWEQI